VDRQDPASSWQYWWAFNRDPYLRLRGKLDRNRLLTGSSNWLLGGKDRNHGTDIERPSKRFLEERVAPVLARAAESENSELRAFSLLSLGRIGLVEQVPNLVRALSDSSRVVKEGAVIGLGLSRQPSVVPALANLAEDSPEGRRAARVTEVPPRLRAFAAIGLGFVGGDEAETTLLRLVEARASGPDLPLCAMIGLSMMEARDAAPSLRRILDDRSRSDLQRSFAANALGRLGDREALASLLRVLREKEWQTSRSAVLALGMIAEPSDRGVIRSLASLVRDGSDPQTRYWACIALGEIGGPASRAVLLEALASGLPEVRSHAALGLGILGSSEPDAAYSRALADGMRREKDPLVRSAHAIALGILGDIAAIPALREALDDASDPREIFYGAVALGMLADRTSLAKFRAWVRDESIHPDVRHAAALAVGLMGDRSVLRALETSMLETESPVVRDGSTVALGFLGDCTSMSSLRKMLEDRTLPEAARVRAALAIGLAGEDSELPLFHRFTNHLNYRNPVDSIGALLHQF